MDQFLDSWHSYQFRYCSVNNSGLFKINARLNAITWKNANADIVEKDEKKFHRAPRYYAKMADEAIEIEAPPAQKLMGKKPLWMTIGPSFTMVIPMLLGSLVAIISARSAGSETSIYMFTGIFTAASSAIVGAFWAITNLRYAGKEEKKYESLRQEAYRAYLEERERVIVEKTEKVSATLRQMYPAASEVVCYDRTSTALWNRNRKHEDFLCPRIGVGKIKFPVEILIPKERFSMDNDELLRRPNEIKERYEYINGAPIQLDLFQNRLFGVVGGKRKIGCYDFVRTLIAQIAACNCYIDVKIGLLYDKVHDDGKWDYVYWLPHVWSEDKKTRYIASNKQETSDVLYELLQIFRMRSEQEQKDKVTIPKPYYIMIIANPELLEGEPIAKYIYNGAQNCGLTTFLLTDTVDRLPNECENILQVDGGQVEIYNVNQEESQTVVLDQVSESALNAFARRILSIRVNETEEGSDVPNSLSFLEMYGVNRLFDLNVAENWKKSRTYETMRAIIGVKAGGAPCYLDIHEKYHGPHGLVAGTTGSGKSETLQTYMLSLAVNFSPEDIGFFIIDFKGGGMAGLFDGLPHLIGSISNLSGNQIRRAMISIKSENKRRQRLFSENGVNNINLYTKLYKNGEVKQALPHMFIIVDEFAELKREEPEFLKELISVAQVGRSLGVHLILSTQKPSGTVDDNIWSNSKFRLCLRVQDRQDSTDMLHRPDAAYITQTGRGYLQVGSDEVFELFQSGYSGAVYDETAGVSKGEIASMIAINGKISLIGNHQTRVWQEHKRKQWIEKLVLCIAAAMEECRQNIEEFAGNAKKTDFVYRQIEKNHIAYEQSDYNDKRIEALIGIVKSACADGSEKTIGEVADKVIAMAAIAGIRLPEEKKKTQLDAVVEYLAEVAKKEGYSQQMQLWMPPLSNEIVLDEIADRKGEMFDENGWKNSSSWSLQAVVGITDDPENQAQLPLMVDLTESGNIAVCGSVISGKSTFLQTLIYGLITAYPPSNINFYLLDFSSRMLSGFVNAPHVGGVLYEDDTEKIDKLFFMIGNIIAERKRKFQGGNFAQYIKAHGVELPMIVIVIDNLGGFREKTDGKYDEMLTHLIKEGISYGVQLVVSAAGFSSSEISSKMADGFKTTFTLQLNDKYSYCDVLRTNQIEILPENNVKGRGLARVGEAILEYQTAISVAAEDDYSRLEMIDGICLKMQDVWKGFRAKMIPVIPEKPVWTEFEALDEYKKLLNTKRFLPIGYNLDSAEVYGIDLAKTFIYLVSGRSRTGKTTFQRAVMHSASRLDSELVVIEHTSGELKMTAEAVGARYISSKQEQAEFFSEKLDTIRSRNQRKRLLESEGKDEIEIFEQMMEEPPIFVIISDIVEFVQSVNKVEAGIRDISAFVKNVAEKGSMLNLYFFVGINPDTFSCLLGNSLFTAMTNYHVGAHFGGAADSIRYMDFNQIPFTERSRTRKAGLAMLPSGNEERVKEVVIPMVKR